MTEPARSNPSLREIPVPAGGDVDLRLGSNRLHIRAGRDGVVTIRARDGEDLDRELEIVTGHGYVKVMDGGAGTFRLGPIALRSGHAPDLDVEIPRDVRLSVRTVSGDVTAVGIAGPNRWTTAAGDLKLELDGGPVTVETVSGDARITASVPLAVTARTVSGDVRVRAPRVMALDAATTSGDVEVDAALSDAAHHTVTSVSGDVRLITGSEVTVTTQSVAGDIRASMPHRTEGTRGRRTVVVGSGRVHVAVRTMSGDVQLRQGRADDAPATPVTTERPADPPLTKAAWDAVSPEPPAPVAPPTAWPAPAAPTPPSPPAPPVAWPSPSAGNGVAAASSPLADAPSATTPDVAPVAEPAATPVAATRPSAAVEDERLEILRALERGDLDVDAAWQRLDALEPSPTTPAAG
jgi:hypothetical protein